MSTWIKDPLLLFLAAGAVLFAVFSLLRVDDGSTPVTLSDASLALMFQDYEVLTGKAPDAEMREAIVRDYYRREILYREGLRQEVVRDSVELRKAVIKEMQQRVSGELDEPSPADLVDFYTQNIDRYYREASITFEQYFLTEAPDDPEALLAAIAAGEAPPSDRASSGLQFPAYGESMIRGLFGADALAFLQGAPLSRWVGPLETLEGWHYFRVAERGGRELQPFERVASEVLVDYQSSVLDERIDAFVDDLAEQYPLQLPAASAP